MKQSEAAALHWADQVAHDVIATGRPPVISTGISPSGEIHIGNMREVLTADAVFRALADRGLAARFNYIADNFDPLRRVYPFLDPTRYGAFVGHPLSEIPCPCNAHSSYSAHFLEPFLAALTRLGLTVEVEYADQIYKSGRMTPFVLLALERSGQIAEILHEMTGKNSDAKWTPFSPLCPDCRRIDQARVTAYSVAAETVDFSCACGASGTQPIAGGGKLVWRIDWPARWMLLGVTVEPFGKDHSTRGGSYDTGIRIVREIFGGEPPLPIPYEWIRLKGQGDMSSSRGNVLSIARMVEVVPPEVLRYFVIRERPQKSIEFDPGLPLLRLVDEVDDAASVGRDERSIALSLGSTFRPVGVPFKHLIVAAQTAAFDAEGTLKILRRTGYDSVSPIAIRERIEHARRWLAEFAPEDLKFELRRELPPEVSELDPAQRCFLERLSDDLDETDDGENIHRKIYEIAKEFAPIPAPTLFQAVYLALLGRSRGPRAGYFIALVGIEFCALRFRQAARAGSGS